MIYRDDVAALEARLRTLDADLAKQIRARDELARLLVEARQRAHQEQAQIDAALRAPARRRLRGLIAASIVVVAGMIGMAIHQNHQEKDRRLAAVLQRYEQFTNDVCRCHDVGCVQHTMDRFTAWASEMARDKPPADEKLDDATVKRFTDIGRRFGDCVTAAQGPAPHVLDAVDGAQAQ